MSYTETQRLIAARSCVNSARGELVNVLSWEGETPRLAKGAPGAFDRAAYRLQLAANHVRRLA